MVRMPDRLDTAATWLKGGRRGPGLEMSLTEHSRARDTARARQARMSHGGNVTADPQPKGETAGRSRERLRFICCSARCSL